MKLTREQLHYFIDTYPKEVSAEEVVISLICLCLTRNPKMIPLFIEQTSNLLYAVTEKFISSMYTFRERAWYLESYLDGKMYSEEYSNTEEAKEIQKKHATFIKKRCDNILGGKLHEDEY